MHATLVSPNLLVQRNDPFTTGVVYMPISLAYIAAALRKAGVIVNVIDAFGENPKQTQVKGNFKVLGLTCEEVAHRIFSETNVVIVFANQLTNHLSLSEIIHQVKADHPHLAIAVLENTQAVTAYALNPIASELFGLGADYLLTGEAETSVVQFVQAVSRGEESKLRAVPGLQTLGYSTPPGEKPDLDALEFPAWDLFPVENYWNLRFSHGPQTSKRYLPLLTSRGCPYPCEFCVVPATNKMKWRGRSPESILAEMRHLIQHYGVREFHLEDLNPTVDDNRIREFSRQLIEAKLDVTWKLVAGTKVETMKTEETIDLMAEAGCRYISISPETGSPRILKLMRKPFRLEHAVKLIQRMNQKGIRSQACFVLGFPGELDEDLQLTRRMIHELTAKGVDEIALFIISPVPGSGVFDKLHGYRNLSELNFTPTWREDYAKLVGFRKQLYREFLIRKTLHYPWKIARQSLNFLLHRFETKMEMVPYRALVYSLLRPKRGVSEAERQQLQPTSDARRKNKAA